MLELDAWIADAIAHDRDLLVATDFDGAVAPIVENSAFAFLVLGARSALQRLSMVPGARVAVVSRRTLADLAERCHHMPDLWLGAEHGSFLAAPGGPTQVLDKPSGSPERLSSLLYTLAELTMPVRGARLDVKEGGIALHYYGVDSAALEPLLTAFRAAATKAGASVLEGRYSCEARYRTATKAVALRALLRGLSADAAVIYAGDEAHDPDAFQFVRARKHGLAFHVASLQQPAGSSASTGVIDGPAAWVAMLSLLAEAFAPRTRQKAAGGAA